MSGIAGIVLAPGRSVDASLLQRMAASLRFRAPDGDNTWIGGAVGFAHAVLRTGNAAVAPQPCTLDGSTWITADARIDGRADLIRRLEPDAHGPLSTCDDAQLILHAYRAWGERCVDHLLGDFAFAIWDGSEQRLFCARDHFGVKPFFYAEVDGGLVFSNTLDCVRTHPAVSDALDEWFIADFLVCGCSQQLTATAFAQVKRLAPGHCLSMAGGTTVVRRYWSLPTADRIRYRKSADYVEHFRELLDVAVGDRIRDCEPAIWMSGGLDSTALAATAQRLLTKRGAAAPLRAYTVIYESLFDDNERCYAEIASRAIGTATQYLPADHGLPFAGWDNGEVQSPEPIDDPYHLLRTQQLREMAGGNRVALSGDGGDEVLWRSYVADLVGAVPAGDLIADLARCLFIHRRRPPLGIRAKVETWRGHVQPGPQLPEWLNPDMVHRLDLETRFRDNRGAATGLHPLRPEASRRLSSPFVHSFLEGHDSGITRVALEHRWPFLDVRLVGFLLAIPPVPWCVDKLVVRVAMSDSLPEVLLRRPKTPLPADPLRAHLQRTDLSWFDSFVAAPELSRFVNRNAVRAVSELSRVSDP
ncbi:MAG TPA: asparagine synthase-related protein, partial [Vicinamibacterales bacterium]|nr:asparagine synthase-related protein [Vicinamibacterales bacterium]